MCAVAVATKPSCWAVLPQGNQVSIIVAVEDSLYVLDPFEPKLQVMGKLLVDLLADLFVYVACGVQEGTPPLLG